MSATPRVSVVFAATRVENLRRAVYSVLRQGFSDLELIAVEAADVPGLHESLAQIAAQDTRLRTLACGHRDDAGLCQAGAAVARGEFIAFLRADDEWLMGRLEQQLALLQSLGPECVAVGGHVLRYAPGALPEIARWPTLGDGPWADPAAAAQGGAALVRSGLLRRAAVTAADMVAPDAPAATWQAWLQRLLAQGRVAMVPAFVAVAYEPPGSIVNRRPPAHVRAYRRVREFIG